MSLISPEFDPDDTVIFYPDGSMGGTNMVLTMSSWTYRNGLIIINIEMAGVGAIDLVYSYDLDTMTLTPHIPQGEGQQYTMVGNPEGGPNIVVYDDYVVMRTGDVVVMTTFNAIVDGELPFVGGQTIIFNADGTFDIGAELTASPAA